MKVVFFGTPAWSAVSLRALAASRHEVVGVVTAPDRARGRSGTPRPCEVALAARELGLAPILQPDTLRGRAVREPILALRPDVLAVVAFGRILPGRLLDAPPHGAVNVHFSLLPRHRGASPVQHAILVGDAVTGVTTMRMDRGLDTGPVLLSETAPIGPRETACELGARLAVRGAALLVDTLDGLDRGELEAHAQDEERATLAPLLRKEDGYLDWEHDASAIDARIRAFSRWPPVVCHGPRGTLRLLEADPVDRAPGDGRGDTSRPAKPGAVLGAHGVAFDVACGNGTVLRVGSVQPAGRRAMPGAGALSGGYVVTGTRLGDGPAP